MNSILYKGKKRVENQTKLESENTRVYVQKPRLKMPFKNSISAPDRERRLLPCQAEAEVIRRPDFDMENNGEQIKGTVRPD
jgi:hypothetical protein